MIDSHTHLDRLETGWEPALAAAWAEGVTKMLTVGTDVESSRAALAIAHSEPGVRAAVGLHPNSASLFGEPLWEELCELARDPACAAIGETGVDHYRDRAPREAQLEAFRAHIELARTLGKPLVIHTREADEDTLTCLEEHAGGLQVILHCFSMPSRIAECVARGWWISYAGNVTYPANAAIAETIPAVPLDRLLVETDAPYLTPQPVRKHRNQPAFVTHTASFVAERRGMAYDELDAAVTANAEELFGW